MTYAFKGRHLTEGDLVLIIKKDKRERTPFPVLCRMGTVGLTTGDNIPFLRPAQSISLREPERYNEKFVASVACDARGGLFEDKIAQLYLGKEEITDYLTQRNWEPHAEWISRLPTPAIFPKAKSVRYIE
jgi:hypothetical protein